MIGTSYEGIMRVVLAERTEGRGGCGLGERGDLSPVALQRDHLDASRSNKQDLPSHISVS